MAPEAPKGVLVLFDLRALLCSHVFALHVWRGLICLLSSVRFQCQQLAACHI